MRVKIDLLKEMIFQLKLMHGDTLASQKVGKEYSNRGNFIFKDLEVGRSTFEDILKIYILFSRIKKNKGKDAV